MKVDVNLLLHRIKEDLKVLCGERDRLAAEIVDIDAAIGMLIGAGPQPRTRKVSFKRFKNERTLLGTIRYVMQGKPHTLDDITDLVLKAGYKSRGDRASVKNMIYQKLYTAGKRNADGTYSLKRAKRSLAANSK